MDTIGGTIGGLFKRQPGSRRMSTGEMVVRSAVQSAARSIGTQITRAIFKGLTGGGGRGIADLGGQPAGDRDSSAADILDVKPQKNPLRPNG